MTIKRKNMEEKLHSFLQSGILERYLVGDTSTAENLEVEHHISNYPEVANAFEELQQNLEIMAKVDAVEAPLGVLNNILQATKENTEVKSIAPKKVQWFNIAASITILLLAGSTALLYIKNQELKIENQIVVEEIYDLRDDIQNNDAKLKNLALEMEKLNNPDSKKYLLEGNDRAKDLKTVAYINPIEKTSMIDVISLPKLPENQYYLIRAELENKMVNLGILDDSERRLKPIPYMEDALALSITIENRDGDASTSESSEVAEISLKD